MFEKTSDGYPILTVSTAAGTIIRPTVEAIDQMLSQPSSRYMFDIGDADRLLDARLVLAADVARQGNTTAVGLGYAHQRDRRAAIAAMPDGTPCGYCGQPMHRTQQLHYDHVIPRALDPTYSGPRRIVHALCNMRAGSALGNQRRWRGGAQAHDTTQRIHEMVITMADTSKCTTCKGAGKIASGHKCTTCGGTGAKTG